MKTRTHKQGSRFIVYDADCIEHPGEQLFDPAYWHGQGALAGEAAGRGSATFVDGPFGPAVLRRYLRGGKAALLSRDRYLFTGYSRARPVAEFNLLATLSEAALPVPAPLGGLCHRHGVVYTGSLLTRRIIGAVPLAERLADTIIDPDLWPATGACIRRFHDYGVVHADLNARNILVGPAAKISLIDFDRGRIAPGRQHAFAANLARLRRSLEKLWPADGRSRLETCWAQLQQGYAGR
jgi:3-deoxy-D-manno-octulosonic acid kinase